MTKERQLALGLDVHEAFKALRLDITDVEVMMDNLERSFGRKPTQRNPIRDLPSLKLPEGGRDAASVRPRGLHLSAMIDTRYIIAKIVVKQVGGELQIEVYDEKGVVQAVQGHDYSANVVSENTTTARIVIHLLRSVGNFITLNIDKQFRTGSAYLTYDGQKLGVTELKEVTD